MQQHCEAGKRPHLQHRQSAPQQGHHDDVDDHVHSAHGGKFKRGEGQVEPAAVAGAQEDQAVHPGQAVEGAVVGRRSLEVFFHYKG